MLALENMSEGLLGAAIVESEKQATILHIDATSRLQKYRTRVANIHDDCGVGVSLMGGNELARKCSIGNFSIGAVLICRRRLHLIHKATDCR